MRPPFPSPPPSCARDAQTASETPSAYRIELALDPGAHALSATVDLRFSSTGLTEHTDFYLHRTLARGLAINNTAPPALNRVSVEDNPSHPYHYLEGAARLRLHFDPPLRSGTDVELSLGYSGEIDLGDATSANVIGANWTEIGLYLPWFPYHPDHTPFTYRLNVADLPSYDVVDGSPVQDGQRSDGWRFASPAPTRDIVVVAAPDLRTRRSKDSDLEVRVHTVAGAEERAEVIGREALTIARRFHAWFGGDLPSHITLIVSARSGGGSYARRGLIVLAGRATETSTADYAVFVHRLAHEVAHLWWHRAAVHTWEDWLNESLAEYSALLAMRDLVGRVAFSRQIALKRAKSAGAPALWGFARGDVTREHLRTQAERMLYHKGPVLIHELVGQIGRDDFLEVCRRIVDNETMTTRDLLQTVTAVTGGAARHWLEDALRR